MIYDCFSFFNELDVLELRFNILGSVVDRFVLVESAWTHTGKNKPFCFEENKSRFSQFASKIIHVKLSEMPTPPPGGKPEEQRWFLENFQRNAIVQGLKDARPNDIIMVSDCDEIPDPDVVKKLPRLKGITHFNHLYYYYYLNLRNYSQPFSGNGTTALRYRDFLDEKTYRYFPYASYVPALYNIGPTATKVRFVDPTRRIRKGWHFSFLGGAAAVSRKIKSTADGNMFGDANMPLSEIESRIERGEDLFKRGDRFFAEPLVRHHPQHILQNSSKLAKLTLPVNQDDFRATRISRLKVTIKGYILRFPLDHISPIVGPIRRRVYAFLHCSV